MIFRSHLIRSLVARGHDVLCMAPDFAPAVRAHVEELGALTADYPLARRGLNPLDDIKSLRALLAQMRSFRPDVVMGYTPKPAIYGSIAARIARVPRIVPMITGLGIAFLGQSRRDRALQFLSRRLYARAFRSSHAAIFHNKEDQRQLSRVKVLPAGFPARVVGGSGVDLAQFGETPLPAVTDGLSFLMVARLLKYKGVLEFCEAAREVKKTTPNARFVLVGPEEHGPGGLTAADMARWQDCVTYAGPQSDVRPYLARCHVFVLPSYDGEGLPRTVLEAMATGRPIITTDSRGCRETVDERVNGCLVPIGDAKALAEAMRSFLRRPDLIPAMARASRQKAVRRFDVEIVTRDTMAILLPGVHHADGVHLQSS
jgi:glycosyltransferase involved in cell wall biosynthesis